MHHPAFQAGCRGFAFQATSPPFFDASRPVPTLPPLAGKRIAGSLRLSTKMMVHVSRYAGTHMIPGDGKPPRFCLEYGCIAFVNLRSVLLAVFCRPLSRCYPLSYYPPVLRLCCADGAISVPSLDLQTLHREDARKGRCAGGDNTHPQALLLPGRHRVSVVEKVTVQLSFFPDMKHEATDRFMRDIILCCNCTERFFLLHHTLHLCWPMGSGNTICRVLWPWPPMLDNSRRMASLSCLILSKQALHLLIQFARRSKEEVENW